MGERGHRFYQIQFNPHEIFWMGAFFLCPQFIYHAELEKEGDVLEKGIAKRKKRDT